MNLPYTAIILLRQLDDLLQQLPAEEYSRPIDILSGATIGQHCRHVIECFEELDRGYASGMVNYDNRRRDRRVETEIQYARRRIAGVQNNLHRPDIQLTLCTMLDDETEVRLRSSYYRELYHNLDHAIHHMALIRAGISEFEAVDLPLNFGVATATQKFRSAPMTEKLN